MRPARARRLEPRTALAVALENAVEGCVFETFGAAIATFQAARAEDPSVRAAFERIAVDERAHASLAEDVHVFLASRLDDAGRETVRRARERAVARLRASRAPGDDRARRALGLPSTDEHQALARLIAEAVTA
ncbi:MAG: hypothetical protein U0414_32745 [Polyangiaceae bacterium]